MVVVTTTTRGHVVYATTIHYLLGYQVDSLTIYKYIGGLFCKWLVAYGMTPRGDGYPNVLHSRHEPL